MDCPPAIFIASSTEGNVASNAIEAQLKAIAGDSLIIKHWTKQFQLSKVYIESLEDSVNNCDFGVFVLTADDLLNIRKVKTRAPRDNVIFELGLFMGRLGRNRCFIFVQTNNNSEVKMPSDLLGLENSKFTSPTDNNWEKSLTEGCKSVIDQVHSEGKLYRLPESDIVKEYVNFRERIRGSWWNKIATVNDGSASFIVIENDEAYNSIELNGKRYSNKGKVIADWESQMSKLIPKKQKLIYQWVGKFQNNISMPFSGFGELQFRASHTSPEKILRAEGHFSDINAATMQEASANPITLRRESDRTIIEIMVNGSEKEKAAIVHTVSKNW